VARMCRPAQEVLRTELIFPQKYRELQTGRYSRHTVRNCRLPSHLRSPDCPDLRFIQTVEETRRFVAVTHQTRLERFARHAGQTDNQTRL
jgi:hypothetical protein